MEARQHAQDLGAAGIDPDVAADGVEHIDRLGFAQFPGPRDVGIGLRGQRPDRAQIDDVGRQLGAERLFDIGSDLHRFAAPRRAELLDPGDLGQKTDAARAMDAAVHAGRDQGAQILVAHRSLVFLETAAVEPVGHRLVLQIALPALIADRAIERMIDQQHFHDAVARLDRGRRLGVDDVAFGDRHRAGGYRLWRFLDLDQAHPAVAGDHQPFVVAEMRDLDAGLLARLQDRRPRRDLDLLPVDRYLRHDRCLNPRRGE